MARMTTLREIRREHRAPYGFLASAGKLRTRCRRAATRREEGEKSPQRGRAALDFSRRSHGGLSWQVVDQARQIAAPSFLDAGAPEGREPDSGPRNSCGRDIRLGGLSVRRECSCSGHTSSVPKALAGRLGRPARSVVGRSGRSRSDRTLRIHSAAQTSPHPSAR